MGRSARLLACATIAAIVVAQGLSPAIAAFPAGPRGTEQEQPLDLTALRERSERRAPDSFLDALGRAPPRGLIDAVAQFRGKERTEGDLSTLSQLGIEVVRAYDVVPAYHVRGPPAALEALIAYPRLLYLEPNRVVALDQDTSTTVINASLVWQTRVLGAESYPGGIDGTGVTIVVVDTGIDAGHPDLDYGGKVLANLQETLPGIWTSFENTDTNYGHGTHVAGTVAGNGEASAGGRRGVAPGANLIGLTVTIADTSGYLAALNWIYENTRPGANTYNIRGHTNSWHTSVGEYDPSSALSQAIEALTFEHNVLSTWSAGNDGRTDPLGTTITTSQQGTTPVAIVVAAYVHNGSAVADFSSRGQVGLEQTYPDVGAPGVQIWSTSARRTLISSGTYSGGNTNPYYLAISGTSMSTPHTAGATALLWQAAPSLTISNRHEDYNGSDPEGWEANPLTRIHEIEWILQATALYLPPDAAHGNPANDTQVGMDGQMHDYVQGYGIIDMRRAVAVALSLEKLRHENPGRNVTVADALEQEAGTQYFGPVSKSTDRVGTQWQGEYGRFTDLAQNTLSSANQTKFLYMPPGATTLDLDLNFVAVDIDRKSIGDLTWAVDWNRDGTNEQQGSISPAIGSAGHKTASLSVPGGAQGGLVAVNVLGNGIKLQQPFRDHVYAEWRSHYVMGATVTVDLASQGTGTEVDPGNYSSMIAPWSLVEPSSNYASGELVLSTSFIDVRAVSLAPPPARPGGGGAAAFGAALLLVLVVGAVLVLASRSPAFAARIRRLPGGPLLLRASSAVGPQVARVRALASRGLARLRRARA